MKPPSCQMFKYDIREGSKTQVKNPENHPVIGKDLGVVGPHPKYCPINGHIMKSRRNWPGLHYAAKFLLKKIEAPFDVFQVLPPGKDDLPGREQKGDDFRLLDPVDEARELFGFIFDIFKV